MKKVELLSPAGSYESAIAAIQNGCDAIYLAGNRFGARAFASNFDNETLQTTIAYAHSYGVRVYVTLNTLIFDEECKDCFEYIEFLYTIHVDAVIVQDLGVLYYIRKHYPTFEVHASTQMHVVNEEALNFLEEIGIPRAVLAREVMIEEIRKFAKHNVELEVFVHGALCVSYSGQCLMSSMVGGRSGNRGECAQSCRMPYTLIDNNTNKVYGDKTYLLSLKDLNTVDDIQTLIASGITSFKIEGRMKKSEYVGYITSLYRKAMDQEYFKIDEEMLRKAKILFNRGYTKGFLFSKKGSALSNSYRPNHIGIEIGKVIAMNKNRVVVSLKEELHQNDGIRFLMNKEDFGCMVNKLYVNDLLVNKAQANSVVEIECKEKIQIGSKVLKTSDPLIEKEIQFTYDKLYRKINIEIEVKAKLKKPLKLIIKDGIHAVEVESEQCIEEARTQASNVDIIKKQVSKSNDTIFKVDSILVDMDDAIFIPIQMINGLRRMGLQNLYELRSNETHRIDRAFKIIEKESSEEKVGLSVKVSVEDQLLTCLEEKIERIYVEDKGLFEKYKQYPEVLLCSSRVEKQGYNEVKMIQDIGGLTLSCFDSDTSLNVYNAYSAKFLVDLGARLITLSHELDVYKVEKLMDSYSRLYHSNFNAQVVIYGRVEVMVSEYCPIHTHLMDKDKEHCQLCRHKTYALMDKFKNKYPMHNDDKCVMHLYDYKVKDEIEKLEKYQFIGIKQYRLDFTFEDKEEVKKVIQKAKEKIVNFFNKVS